MKQFRKIMSLLLVALLFLCVLPAYVKAASYDAGDLAKLVAFLEQADEDGVKNGEKAFLNYDKDNPSTFKATYNTVVEWSNGRLVKLILSNVQNTTHKGPLVGVLDLSGCSGSTSMTARSAPSI